jgi:hypothetical protein
MEVHRQYNLRSKKTNDNPTKKVVETKKDVETKKAIEAKKTSDATPRKVPEKNSSQNSCKRKY